MKFIDIIIQNSQAKEAKLYNPSKKASDNPETGITINSPAAFHVIKDCATLAHKYIPHIVFGSYANPFEVLRGKFKKSDIEEFVSCAMSDIVLHQLMNLILYKIANSPYLITAAATTDSMDSTDPYGEYETINPDAPVAQKQQDPVTLLCDVFGV